MFYHVKTGIVEVSANDLEKQAKGSTNIDGGTISKDELKAFVDEGKVGTMSKPDFDAMWVQHPRIIKNLHSIVGNDRIQA